jgi:hypothetical protein
LTFDPDGTVFVLLSFEGPDVYSQAGGLGLRVKGLSRSLARMGYLTYLYFFGDPDLPGEEARQGGRLQLSALRERPRLAAGLRKRGRATAKDYVWEKVIEQLLSRVEFAAQQQAVKMPAAESEARRPSARTLRSLEAK